MQTIQTPLTYVGKSPDVNVNTRSVAAPAFGILAFATVRVSPTAYPLPAVVTVTPVTVFPLMTTVKTAPVPPPLDDVAKLVRPALSVASVGFVVMLASNSSAVVLIGALLNPLQY